MAEVVLKHKGSYKMKCLVVDDESIAIRGIVNYISKLDFLKLPVPVLPHWKLLIFSRQRR